MSATFKYGEPEVEMSHEGASSGLSYDQPLA